MKTTIALFLLGSAFLTNTAQASDISSVEKSLRPWQPIEVKKSQDSITITLNENKVTPQIYEAVIISGLCPSVWGASASYLKSIKEVNILNKYKASGYVFENPKPSCNEIGKAVGDKANIILMSNTHMH